MTAGSEPERRGQQHLTRDQFLDRFSDCRHQQRISEQRQVRPVLLQRPCWNEHYRLSREFTDILPTNLSQNHAAQISGNRLRMSNLIVPLSSWSRDIISLIF